MTADQTVHAALLEFREHAGNPKLTLRQKRLAMKGLMHICLPLLAEMSVMTKTSLLATLHEWEFMRAPCEPDFPLEMVARGFLVAAQSYATEPK